jgi:esterase/lipase
MHYNSKDSFNNIVENLNERIQKEVDFKKYNVYIIAHSMGGIVAHYLITDYNLPINSVVMISTPINGSAMANYYSKGILSIFGNIIMGKPLKSISPDNEVIKNITNINYNVGMIIAHKNKFAFSIISNLILNGENDGVVAVEEMKKEGIKDYTYINENHISVLYSPTTHKQAQLFLEEDHFKH